MTRAVPLWLADWSDGEDADFRAAWATCGISTRVLRSPPLGTSVGRRWHRARSWPSYGALAAGGLIRARGAPLVAWQPLAGALAALLRPGRRPTLLVLNPLLSAVAAEGGGGRLLLAGLRRADRVVFFSTASLPVAERLGIRADRTEFVPFGAPARRRDPAPPGDFLLAAGRDHRDWPTLVEACRGLDCEVMVVGPPPMAAPPNVRFVKSVDRAGFLDLAERSRAVVVPLRAGDRPAGQLAVLDAMSVGRAVIATRSVGTEDYVSPATGRLVPGSDPDALRAAMRELLAPEVAASLGRGALEAVRGPLSLVRFVTEIDRLAAGDA